MRTNQPDLWSDTVRDLVQASRDLYHFATTFQADPTSAQRIVEQVKHFIESSRPAPPTQPHTTQRFADHFAQLTEDSRTGFKTTLPQTVRKAAHQILALPPDERDSVLFAINQSERVSPYVRDLLRDALRQQTH